MYHRTEKLPSLKEALEDLKPKDEKMTDDELMKTVMLLNAQFGGTVEEGKTETD